ncbi:hypothetical protein QAD02_009959 [Eretmocerus hayati]|uniref:Uncharacterized protein n=1 Tax=Eretmocerus hayati TaxID=131215 RepID=A0ACC2NBL6_9HYME|nr:hypothetical protein QAD02_009959 [Eretmocerus hayati]
MSNLPFTDEQLEQLKSFVDLYNKQPTIINHPKLEFLKTFLQRLGARLPRIEKDDDDTTESFDKESNCEPEPESEESDLELDMTEPDNDAPQQMGDYDLQPTDEQMEQSQEKRSEAVSAFMETDYEKAIQLYTEAILLNPQASLLYAKRGQVYILLKKPNACIRDCDRAIELNPDSAAAHKFRGRANQLLGKWEEAANDLRKACKYDFDEQADEWLREVTPNVSTHLFTTVSTSSVTTLSLHLRKLLMQACQC